MAIKNWEEAAKAKKASQAELIPKDWKLPESSIKGTNVLGLAKSSGILSAQELEITELDNVDQLIANISSGKWTAYEVTLAYCKRAAIGHQATNCLTEIFFDKALEQAKQLDEQFKATGKTVGPLHGVPISLKDQIEVEGVDCTMGYASWIGNISQRDSVMIQILRKNGAIFYCKTNLPQTTFLGESINFVFGRTSNPFNTNLSCGGSSGGEGALIGFKGSPLGVGTDIGGSIRIPAAYQGLYGLRPTMRRTPYLGNKNHIMGMESIETVLGPLSRSLEGLITFSKTVADSKPWNYDPTCVELPWRPEMVNLEHLGTKKLSFGLIKWNGVVTPHPPIQRALNMVANALKKAGHEVIEWEHVDPHTVVPLIVSMYQADGGDDFKKVTSETNEPLLPGVMVDFNAKKSVHESWQLNLKRDEYRKKYLDAWMATEAKTSTGRPLDGFIGPVAAYAAPLHDTKRSSNFTMHYNLLDYPTCAFPVTSVDPKLDAIDESYKPINSVDKFIYDMYSPEAFKDAPVSLQVAGRRFREEEVLGLTKVIKDSLKHKL